MDQESGAYKLGESKIGTRYHILKYTLLFRLEFCMLISVSDDSIHTLDTYARSLWVWFLCLFLLNVP